MAETLLVPIHGPECWVRTFLKSLSIVVIEHYYGLDVVVVHHGPEVCHGVVHGPLCADELVLPPVAINKDSVDVVGGVSVLEGGQVRPARIGRDDQNVPVLLPVLSPVSSRAVPDGEARNERREECVLLLVGVDAGDRILLGLGLKNGQDLGDGYVGLSTQDVVLHDVVDILEVVGGLQQAPPLAEESLEGPEHVHLLRVFGHAKNLVHSQECP